MPLGDTTHLADAAGGGMLEIAQKMTTQTIENVYLLRLLILV